MSTEFRTMIVPSELVEVVRSLADTFPAGTGMFITPLCPIDAEDVTHYISTGLIDAEIAAVMPWTDYNGEEEVLYAGDPEALAAMLHEQHPEATPEQLEGIIAACDISTQEPHTAANRMGLKILA
jgi:hypothetical protein